MRVFNLVLSGGGVKCYAHLGVYKYCFENDIWFNEIVAVSAGAIVSPFIYCRRDPTELINLFKKAEICRKLFPFWFVPDKFEFLLLQPSTYKIGKWVEEKFTSDELRMLNRLHIMATRNPVCGIETMYTDMLKITDLKNAIAASCAISGIFKEHKAGDCTYIDGGHYYNCPIFFEFEDQSLPTLAVSLGYSGLLEKSGGRVSQILRGLEISSYARVQEDLKRWQFEKTCNKRGDLFVISPKVWNVRSLDFDLKDWQMDELINAGYEAAKNSLLQKEILNV